MPRNRFPRLVTCCVGLLLTTSACSSASDAVTVLDASDAVELIDAGEHTVIDVRTPAEFAAGHVDDAVNIDISAVSFKDEVKALDRRGEYVVYCQSGKRSADATKKMAALGFRSLVDAGGLRQLESAGADIVTDH